MIQGRVFFNDPCPHGGEEVGFYKCAFIQTLGRPIGRMCQHGGVGLMFVACMFVNISPPLGSTVVDCLLFDVELPTADPSGGKLIGCHCYWSK